MNITFLNLFKFILKIMLNVFSSAVRNILIYHGKNQFVCLSLTMHFSNPSVIDKILNSLSQCLYFQPNQVLSAKLLPKYAVERSFNTCSVLDDLRPLWRTEIFKMLRKWCSKKQEISNCQFDFAGCLLLKRLFQ